MVEQVGGYPSKMLSESYHEGYWERGEGSNYVNYGWDPGWPVTLRALQRHVPVGSMLEVACAKGHFVHTALDMGWDVEGIDLSLYAVSHCPQQVAHLVRQGNAVDLPWKDESFDVVCSWEFLEHVYEDEIDRVLDEMERVCVPDGLIVNRIGVDLGDEAPLWERFGTSDPSNQQCDVTHVLEMPRRWWREKFLARGWKRDTEVENSLDAAFHDRDWWGRFFAYRLP